MAKKSPTFSELPIDVVGFNEFGRYPKISAKATWNMIVSDGFLVPFAGHKIKSVIDTQGSGRGIFNSERYGKLIVVIDDGVYVVNEDESWLRVATLETVTGDVYMDENDANQIAICDRKNIYIYATNTGVFTKAVTGFTPGYVAFHDGYFIAPDVDLPQWRLSAINDGLTWPAGAQNVGYFQTKPDNVQAALRLPGKGNQLLVMGGIVTEAWQDVGAQLFPYQRSTGFNIDYGVLSVGTIASGDSFVIWLGVNEKSGPVIMYTSGGDAIPISNDGINYKLAHLKNPAASYGFLFKQDGHLIYVISFIDAQDNFTLAYDFNNNAFVYLSDEYMNYHIAKKVVYFNNKYYFISFKDGNLYELNSIYTTYDGAEIPRIRITGNVRAKDTSPFIGNNFTFTIEQGENSESSVDDIPGVIDKGNITVAADFPNPFVSIDDWTDDSLAVFTDDTGDIFYVDVESEVQVGWLYHILATVTDNDPTKTDTGQSFLAGDTIMWNGTNWSLLQENPSVVDLSISTDGGRSFGNYSRYTLNTEGNRKNKIQYWHLGYANDLVLQLRFYGLGRFVASNGILSIYQ